MGSLVSTCYLVYRKSEGSLNCLYPTIFLSEPKLGINEVLIIFNNPFEAKSFLLSKAPLLERVLVAA